MSGISSGIKNHVLSWLSNLLSNGHFEIQNWIFFNQKIYYQQSTYKFELENVALFLFETYFVCCEAIWVVKSY